MALRSVGAGTTPADAGEDRPGVGQDLPLPEAEEALLIGSDLVEVDLVETGLDEAGDGGQVLLGGGAEGDDPGRIFGALLRLLA